MKRFINFLILFLLTFSLSCCDFNVIEDDGSSDKDENKEIIKSEYLEYPTKSNLEYVDYGTINGYKTTITEYNKKMWYYNELSTLPYPDPFVFYEDGVYYLTGTNDAKEGDTIEILRTSDFVNFYPYEAYVPHAEWEKTGKDSLIFAPEIFKYGEYYYLTYSNLAKEDNLRYITFVRSKSIMGPFEVIQTYNSNGDYIDGNSAPLFTHNKSLGKEALDQHILNDNGKLYLYHSIFDQDSYGYIVGMEMIDPITPDMSTYKTLIIPGEPSPDSRGTNLYYWESYNPYPPVSEGPFVIKSDNGKYYLTYSVNHYPNRYYSVCYAVSDSPLGDYVKPYKQNEAWTNLLFGYGGGKEGDIYNDWGGFMSGCGHHAFFYAGSELMVVYHAHMNHGTEMNPGWMPRSVAFDRVLFDSNGDIYVNGPTYSLELLPEVVCKYKNIAGNAKVSAINVEDIHNINDNYIVSNFNLNSRYLDKEVILGSGVSYILLEFDKEYEIGGVSVYNSSKYEEMVYEIEYINFFNDNVVFKSVFPKCFFRKEKEFIYPNSAFTIEVSNVKTDKILLCFDLLDQAHINEIKVYAKEIE